MKLNSPQWVVLLTLLGFSIAGYLPAQPVEDAQPGRSAAVTTNTIVEDPVVEPTNPAGAPTTNGTATAEQEQNWSRPREIVQIRKDVLLKSNETAAAVVIIGGSATVHGKVNEAIVTIGGDIDLTGECESAVAILGNINTSGKAKANELVSILGNINAKGNTKADSAVSVGGKVDLNEDAHVSGETVSLQLPGIAAPEWLHQWFRECAMKLRPFAPGLPWLWVVAAFVIGFYFLVGMVFRTPVRACRDVILERPATSLMVGLLTKMLAPLLIFILGATGVGLLVVPFVIAALVIMGILGKAAILEAAGAGLGRGVNATILQKPALAFLIGALIVLALYMIPIVGLLVFLLLGCWALGAAVLAMSAGMRRERRRVAPVAAAAPAYASATGGTVGSAPADFTTPAGSAFSSDPLADPVGVAPGVPPATADLVPPRYAGFWHRMGAGFLDLVLVGIISGIAGGGRFWWIIALAYFAGMWTWRGTTVGGVVLGLKVVRVDGRHLSFPAALLRSVTAAFSAICLFLGFFWIAWDPDKQAWHDKVTGTYVVKQDRPAPLLCV